MTAILPPPGPVGSNLPPDQVAKAQKAATEFEAMTLGALLAPMFETVDMSKGPFGGGAGEQQWRSMMVSELAKGIARNGGLGIARPVLAQMLRMQEARNAAQEEKP